MKQIHNVNQGSKEWLELRAKYFTASEAAAMLGLSKYQTRSELLHMKSTGEVGDVTEYQQKIFDKGHETEALARSIHEQLTGEELYPATISMEIEGLNLLASMDGMDMLETFGFEHKLWNEDYAAQVKSSVVPDTHWPQLEQQILVSGVDYIDFVVSDGTEENRETVKYESIPERRAQLLAGWKQFASDLASYVPEDKADVIEAEPVRDLPAISYKMDGLSLISNLDTFKAAATDLVEKSKAELETDQDFANAESRQKIFTKAEKDIKALADQVLGEVADIDAFTKDLKFIGEQIRQARLAEGKQVKARKEQIKNDIANQAVAESLEHAEIFRPLGVLPPRIDISIADAMKGKKTVDSLKDAANTALAQIKIELDRLFHVANENAGFMQDYKDYKFLFSDWKDIAFKASDDFQALVKSRIADHKESEQKRLDAQREQIRLEEEAKAERAAQAKIDEAKRLEAERDRIRQQEEAKATAKANAEARAKQEAEQLAEAEALRELAKPQEVEQVTEQEPKHTFMAIPQSVPTEKPVKVERKITEYEAGFLDGLKEYAHWKDGTQYVGTNGKTLNEAVEQFLKGAAA